MGRPRKYPAVPCPYCGSHKTYSKSRKRNHHQCGTCNRLWTEGVDHSQYMPRSREIAVIRDGRFRALDRWIRDGWGDCPSGQLEELEREIGTLPTRGRLPEPPLCPDNPGALYRAKLRAWMQEVKAAVSQRRAA